MYTYQSDVQTLDYKAMLPICHDLLSTIQLGTIAAHARQTAKSP